jgi:hypothetical protein
MVSCGLVSKNTNDPKRVSSAAVGTVSVPERLELERELSDARRRERATDEVLRVFSRSPANAQPVFDAIAESARRLCDGKMSALYRFDGKLIHHIAHHNWTAEGLEADRCQRHEKSPPLPFRPAPSRSGRDTHLGSWLLPSPASVFPLDERATASLKRGRPPNSLRMYLILGGHSRSVLTW